ncbi:MAG: spherulation-specific family 4 protein [Isosphaerales bacterium]
MLVPAYIYPGGDGRKEWQRLIDAASKVEIVAIANPNSGPGYERNLDYAAIFTEASDHGITLVGYVSTGYVKRPIPAVKNDIDAWVRLYPQVRGFFFDQQSREGHDAPYYAELRAYAAAKLRDPLVITNPGIPCDEAYLAQAVANVTCVFVNDQGFDQFELPAPLKVYEASRYAALPYNISDVGAMRAVVKDAIIKRIGYLYISDAKKPNQWGKLPSYWEAEVEAVARVR